MTQAKKGDTVKVHYTGKLEDGQVFDSSEQREPLEFKIGGGQIIPGFDQAVEGMEPQDKKTITVPADSAYGPHRSEMIFEVERDKFPEGMEPQLGQRLELKTGEGHPLLVTVARVEEEKVALDANHPLAGKDLTFEIELVEVA